MEHLNAPKNIKRVLDEIAQSYACGIPLLSVEIRNFCKNFGVTTDVPKVALYIKIAEKSRRG